MRRRLYVELLALPSYTEGRAIGRTERATSYMRARRRTSLATAIRLARLRGHPTLAHAIAAGEMRLAREPEMNDPVPLAISV